MNEHLAAAATATAAIRTESSPQWPGTAHIAQFFPLFQMPTHLLPTLCGLAPELGCPPCARKLFTKGNNSDKGIKIAGNGGKHFVERSVDKRGNRAVKKIGAEGY